MKEYLDEIIENTAEKERVKAEMEAATQIQKKMLPAVAPDFYGKNGYELFAKMETAKEVGGDLYDFYYLDDDRLVLMIGDVSGKGITAALFMALSKQMIKSQVLLHGGDLVEAMNEANKRLCEESVDAMFVTAWIGVLTLSTGALEFVNAGHVYAAVKRDNGEFVLEEDDHCVLMAGVDFAKYKLNRTTLNAGDVVYLYTDGVTEAHDKDDRLFGEERLLAALNEKADASCQELDETVRRRVFEFAGETEQYDDITTVCFKYTGNRS
jgi:sigma-B regulation protein RsbU (phosphoserine phosphatase)